MLLTVETATCPNCDSERLVKDGKTSSGSQCYLCKGCGKSRVLNPKRIDYTGKQKERILRAHREGTSLRGMERIFGVARQLAFSKSDAYHRGVTKWFIREYNRNVSTSA